jgi:hypothetical protein
MSTRTWVGGLSLAALTLLGLAMAAGGLDVAPAEGIGGAYGGGLGIEGSDFIQLERLSLLAYAAVVACAAALPARLLWGAVVLLIGAFAIAPPLLSLDVFSYLSYARLDVLHGLNPYTAAPGDVPGDEALTYVIDNEGVVSAYGPLFGLATRPLAHLDVEAAAFVLKGVAALSVLATAWLTARLAAARGLDPRPAVALVALNPLVLVHVVGGGHNDSLAALVLTLGVAGVLSGREIAGGAGLVAAAGVKASAAFALPFAALEGLQRRRGLLAGLAVGALGLVGVSLAAFGTGVDGFLDVAGSNQDRGARASVPKAISDALDVGREPVREAMAVLYIALVGLLLVWTARGADWLRAAAWAGLGLLLAASYITPWYVILPLPLIAIARDRALVVAVILFSAFMLRAQVPGLGG